MRFTRARVVLLFLVVLAFANALCFSRCLVQSCDNATPPCHSHGQIKTSVPQHDVRPSTAAHVHTAGSLLTPVNQGAKWTAAIWFQTLLICLRRRYVSIVPQPLRV